VGVVGPEHHRINATSGSGLAFSLKNEQMQELISEKLNKIHVR